MFDINLEYVGICIFILLSFILSLIFILLSYFLGYPGIKTYQKTSSYECGFEPFGDARVSFSVQFYLISILFVIFQ